MPTTRFLFWNLGRNDLTEAIVGLAHSRRVDVIVLTECEVEIAGVLRALNEHRAEFHFSPSPSDAFRVFCTFPAEFLLPRFDSDRLSIRHLVLPAREPVLLAFVHFPSKLHWSNESQAMECTALSRRITAEEDLVGHQRTAVLGDFNMNPFEAGMVAAAGLNSVMTRDLALRAVRSVQGTEYRVFYNPLWSHFGDAKAPTAGSYYYDNGSHVNYFWHIFDQVLLRAPLAAGFRQESMEIVTSVAGRSLVSADGRPDRRAFSDHLPIVFDLEF